MSQDDFIVANQGFPATRSDINSNLQALATNSSGATAPAVTYANQFWYDTANDTLKIRNELNNAWISLIVTDQTNNRIASLTSPILNSGSSLALSIQSNGTTAITIDTSQNVGVGTTTPRAQEHIFGSGQQTASLTDAGARGSMLRLSENSSTAGAGGAILFATSQGDTANSLGFAAIKGLLVSGSSNTTGDLVISNRASATDTSLTERLRITVAGGISFGTGGTSYGTSGQVLQSNGNAPPSWTTISTTASGTLIRAPQVLITGTSYTTPSNCTKIYVEMVGGGGGGGCPGANPGWAGSGAGAAYCAKYFTVTGNTAYTYAIGAGGNGAGPTSGSTGNGGGGGNTTFTVGATTITAGGGGGSTDASATTGGVGGTGTNGDINIQGGHGSRGNSTFPFPFGGAAPVFGVSTVNYTGATTNAVGYGSGGPSSANTSQKSGNGSGGLIRIWEFT